MTEKRVAIVTGGSRGIGEAIVKRLAADGLHVIAVARDSADKLAAVVDAVKSAGGSAEAVACDIAGSQILRRSDRKDRRSSMAGSMCW